MHGEHSVIISVKLLKQQKATYCEKKVKAAYIAAAVCLDVSSLSM
jgi:hypothetical protein